MVSFALVLVCFAFGRGSATAGQISDQRIKQLETERERFFVRTSKLPKSGYTWGSEASEHEIIFPIGRSDVLYYDSSVADEKGTCSFSITKWTAIGRTYQKIWHLPFRASNGGKPPAGTLLSMAFESGFRPITVGSEWTIARNDLERVSPYAKYEYGEEGDVSLQTFADVYDARNRRLAHEWNPGARKLPDGSTTFGYDRMIVLPEEVKLMRLAR
jgi:hypothetical protein